jgi:hypothetical protein
MKTFKIKIKQPGQYLFRVYVCESSNYDRQTDAYVMHLADGSYIQIPQWSKCEIRYTQALVDAAKEADAKRKEELRQRQEQALLDKANEVVKTKDK